MILLLSAADSISDSNKILEKEKILKKQLQEINKRTVNSHTNYKILNLKINLMCSPQYVHSVAKINLENKPS